jgi:hypothetical protein
VEDLSGDGNDERGEIAGRVGEARSDVPISEEDFAAPRYLPRRAQATLMQRMTAHEPNKVVQFDGEFAFERTALRLRRDGYRLIHLQSQETSFSSVWYRKSDGVMSWRRAEITMVVWEEQEDGSTTTVLTWWL